MCIFLIILNKLNIFLYCGKNCVLLSFQSVIHKMRKQLFLYYRVIKITQMTLINTECISYRSLSRFQIHTKFLSKFENKHHYGIKDVYVGKIFKLFILP